jgi:VWFA-related protein
VFPSVADEVNVDFVVRSKKKTVLDLKPEDIVVTDDGSVVKLSDLRLVNGQSGRDHLITFLFDPLDPSSATNARESAKKILKQFPPNGFSFSVFGTDTRLRFFQPFTTDRQLLQKAVGAATEGGSARDAAAAASEEALISTTRSRTDAPSPYDQSVRQALLASLIESRRILQNENTPEPLAGLLALVRALAPVAGRKLLVYFSEGLPPGLKAHDALHAIAGAANRAEVSIYVINRSALDTRMMQGLLVASALGGVASANRIAAMSAPPRSQLEAGLAAQRPTVYGGGMISQVENQMTRVTTEGLSGGEDPLAEVATSTGGAYLLSEDNLKKPFKQAIADLTTYYEASYPSPSRDYDGMFRPIAVKPLRPGLKVQARAGYFAIPPSLAITPLEAALVKILSGQLPADVSFRANVLQLGTMITGNENTLVIEVPVASLNTRRDPNTNLLSWHVSIASRIKDSSGTVVEHFSKDAQGHGTLDSKDETRSACVTMQRHFALPPGEYTLESAVVDHSNGKAGAQRTSFRVGNAASGPFLSDIALVRRLDSFSDEADPLEPLRYEQSRVIVSLSDHFGSETKNLSFFFLAHPDASISDAPVLEMQVMRNGRLFGQVPLRFPRSIREAFPYMASLNASSLPPGDYEVTLSLTQGVKLIERGTRFRIAGSELAKGDIGEKLPGEASTDLNAEIGPSLGATEVLPTRRQQLAITSLPSGSAVRPSFTDLDALLNGAREHALSYSTKLPNFVCIEITDRSVDPSGAGKWRRKDSFAELLRYVDNRETRTTLAINGRPNTTKRTDMEQWPISLGEFGHMLTMVFDPKSKAEFHWKDTAGLADGTIQVFDYRVAREHNSMLLSDNDKKVYAGFHGLAYIDSATKGIRRITMEADDLPADFSIHFASVSVDYDYVSIGSHDYLMPMRGTIRLQRGRHETDLNQVVFQDYKRYASQAKITFAQ